MVIPITVLEELDHFKKGNESLNFHAREFVRTLDLLSGDKLFDGGVRIGQNQGRIAVILEQKYHEDLELNFAPGKSDHRILNTTYHLAKRLSPEKVFLVTKDVNLRMKAKAVEYHFNLKGSSFYIYSFFILMVESLSPSVLECPEDHQFQRIKKMGMMC